MSETKKSENANPFLKFTAWMTGLGCAGIIVIIALWLVASFAFVLVGLFLQVTSDAPGHHATASVHPASFHIRIQRSTGTDPNIPDVVDNIDIDKLARTILWMETRGHYQTVGKDGEYGGYGILKCYWPALSRHAFGKVVPQTQHNQDIVARDHLAVLVAKYHSIRKVAMVWNGGSTKPKKGISRGGVPYDTVAYADKVLAHYQTI